MNNSENRPVSFFTAVFAGDLVNLRALLSQRKQGRRPCWAVSDDDIDLALIRAAQDEQAVMSRSHVDSFGNDLVKVASKSTSLTRRPLSRPLFLVGACGPF
jgi:hypothetical protein